MKNADLTAYADRGRWEAVEEASSAHWLARKRELGPIGGIRDAADLWDAVRAVRPDWPSGADRDADLETDIRVSEALRSVAVAFGTDSAAAPDWLAEAERRDDALDRDEDAGTPAAEVLHRLERRRG